MGFLIAVIIFFLMFVFGTSVSAVGITGVVLFLDIPSLLLVVVPAFAAAISSHSLKGAGFGKIVFGGQPADNASDAVRVFNFLGTFGNAALLLGIIAFFISQILMLADLNDPNTIGPNMAMGLISIMYALVLKIIAYSAQSQVRKKGAIPHDMLNRDDRVWIAYLFAIMPLLTFFILLFAMSKSC